MTSIVHSSRSSGPTTARWPARSRARRCCSSPPSAPRAASRTPRRRLPARDGDRLLVFGSKGGAPTNPAWYHNLVANPTVTVELPGERYEARAVVTEGDEREQLLERAEGRDARLRRLRAQDDPADSRGRARANRRSFRVPASGVACRLRSIRQGRQVAFRTRRATDRDGPLDEHDDPQWIRVLAFAIAAAVAAYGAVGLLLAIAGWYGLPLVLVAGTLVFAGLCVLARPLIPPTGAVSRSAQIGAVRGCRRDPRDHDLERLERVGAGARHPRRRHLPERGEVDLGARNARGRSLRRAVHARLGPAVELGGDGPREAIISTSRSSTCSRRCSPRPGDRWRRLMFATVPTARRRRAPRVLSPRAPGAAPSVRRARGDARARSAHAAGVVLARQHHRDPDAGAAVQRGVVAVRSRERCGTAAPRSRSGLFFGLLQAIHVDGLVFAVGLPLVGGRLLAADGTVRAAPGRMVDRSTRGSASGSGSRSGSIDLLHCGVSSTTTRSARRREALGRRGVDHGRRGGVRDRPAEVVGARRKPASRDSRIGSTPPALLRGSWCSSGASVRGSCGRISRRRTPRPTSS